MGGPAIFDVQRDRIAYVLHDLVVGLPLRVTPLKGRAVCGIPVLILFDYDWKKEIAHDLSYFSGDDYLGACQQC